MKNAALIILSLGFLFAISHKSSAEYTLPKQETYQQTTVEKKSGTLRSRLKGNFEKLGESRYYLKESGTGHYGQFEGVLWTLESETEMKSPLLCPVETTFMIKDKDGRIIFEQIKIFDYTDETIQVTERDTNANKIKNRNFPLNIPTTDDATLIYFLRPFMKDLLEGKTIRFNFISSEPGLYHLKARFIKEEAVVMGPNSVDALKVQITPDVAFLNPIIDKLLPSTLLWYGKTPSHPWLQYEGLECGRGTAHIITTVEKFDPAI